VNVSLRSIADLPRRWPIADLLSLSRSPNPARISFDLYQPAPESLGFDRL